MFSAVLWCSNPEGWATSVVWRPDGKVLCVGSRSGHLYFFSVEHKQQVDSLFLSQAEAKYGPSRMFSCYRRIA